MTIDAKDGELIILPLMHLGILRMKIEVLEVVFKVFVTKSSVKALGPATHQWVIHMEDVRLCWTFNVFYEDGVTTKMTFWENQELVDHVCNYNGNVEYICITIFCPQSITRWEEDLVLNVGDSQNININDRNSNT